MFVIEGIFQRGRCNAHDTTTVKFWVFSYRVNMLQVVRTKQIKSLCRKEQKAVEMLSTLSLAHKFYTDNIPVTYFTYFRSSMIILYSKHAPVQYTAKQQVHIIG
jgi:hypothetical protein